MTVETTVNVLTPGPGSGVDEDTVAVLVTLPLALEGTAYVAVIVSDAPAASRGIVHGRVLHAPVLVTESSVRAGVSVSLTRTFDAVDGPLFVTVIWYAPELPAMRPGAMTDFVTLRSANALRA